MAREVQSSSPISQSAGDQMTEQVKGQLRSRIAELVRSARAEVETPQGYGFLPDIIRSLENMTNCLDAGPKERNSIAGGIGRLVTEDYAFSESALGGALLQLADEFALGHCGNGADRFHKRDS